MTRIYDKDELESLRIMADDIREDGLTSHDITRDVVASEIEAAARAIEELTARAEEATDRAARMELVIRALDSHIVDDCGGYCFDRGLELRERALSLLSAANCVSDSTDALLSAEEEGKPEHAPNCLAMRHGSPGRDGHLCNCKPEAAGAVKSTPAERETGWACPKCNSVHTDGAATGMRHCLDCEHQWIVGADERAGGEQPFDPDWASPPGATIADLIEERGAKRESVADSLGLTLQGMDDLLSGVRVIDDHLAGRIGQVLGSTKAFWLKREEQYREQLARLAILPATPATALTSRDFWKDEADKQFHRAEDRNDECNRIQRALNQCAEERDAAEKRVATIESLEQQAWNKAQFELERAMKAEARIAELEAQLAKWQHQSALEQADIKQLRAQLAAATAGEVLREGDVVCLKAIVGEDDCGTVLRGPDPERAMYQDHVLVKWSGQPGLFDPRELCLVRRRVLTSEESEASNG